MKNITLSNLEKVCGGKLYNAGDKAQIEASCVVIDSRKIEAGGIFIATKGERVDGHDFIPQVFEKGALAVICERLPEQADGPCLLVKDSFAALTAIAEYYRSQLTIPLVGITGSVGKTSTKEMIASVLRKHYRVCATEGNFNNEIGVPLTLLRIRDTDECAVIEMGINHFGEMTRLTKIVRPTIAVITNIGTCHLEALGDRDGVLRAKTEIFTGMSEDGVIVLNGMDDKLATVKEAGGRKILRYGLAEKTSTDISYDVCAEDVVIKGLEGSTAKMRTPKNSGFPVTVPLPGEHMLLNAAAAATVGEILGLTADEIAAGIADVQAVGGRSRVLKGERYTVIDDCYNANPTSVRAALDLLEKADDAGRTLAILGDMFELGDGEKELHAQVGTYAGEKKLHALVCVGGLSEAMAAAAKGSVSWVKHYPTTEETAEHLEEILQEALPQGGTVLVKASHGMHLEVVVDRLKERI